MNDRPLILIVEDDPTVSGLLQTLMHMEGYETLSAKDGLEGLLKAEFRHPALILLDVMMPNVDGERVLEVGQRIDHRDRRRVGEPLEPLLRERAHDDAVHVPREHPTGVLDRLAAAELKLRG